MVQGHLNAELSSSFSLWNENANIECDWQIMDYLLLPEEISPIEAIIRQPPAVYLWLFRACHLFHCFCLRYMGLLARFWFSE
ncbi:unnamed protein product [Litomosoides sigmodontis]|uniref:Uncharacterized protein n=1 Tax=Litomosoides sigmodontis TaxID=42156 RepID=A0A3P7KEL0_LITSI|nr:unnamed protein product [Litomosoides sigmodontis]